MSYYLPGGLGEFRGRTGQVIVYRWRHLKIGRSSSGKPSKEATRRQRPHRSRLGLISGYLSPFVLVLRKGYPSKGLVMNSFNASVQHNIHTAVKGEYPRMKVDDSLIKLSKGTLDFVYRPRLLRHDTGEVTLEWTNPERQKPGLSNNDPVHLVLYRETLRLLQLEFCEDIARRGDEVVNVTDKVSHFKGPVHVWMFLQSEDGKKASDSRYLGIFEFNVVKKRFK